jgi:predicted phage terminase large subunit-like protein
VGSQNAQNVTLKDIETLINSGQLSESDMRVLEAQLDKLEKLKERELAQTKFIKFVEKVWPSFVSGRHHKRMAEAFERVANGACKRLIINMPPRHTKSEFASYLLPAWFLGKFPGKKVIQSSNTGELAVGFGRKVRNLVDSEVYHDIFPELTLQADSKAAGRWNTSKGGDYFAIGVGGTVTGKGADLLIIDDPHSEQEAAMASSNPEVYDKVYEWYTSGPRQRLQPGGAIVIVMCMTGDTNVLMADGTSTQLKDIRPGDAVATFDKGQLGVSKINNWRSSGVDYIHKVQTQSGIILRANERHPFLVMNGRVLEWTRLKDLRPGMLLVATKDANAQQDRKPSPGSAQLAKQEKATTEKTQTPPTIQSATTGNGRGKNARVESQLKQRACAIHATQSNFPQQNQLRSNAELGVSSTGTGLLLKTLHGWLTSAAIGVMFAAKSLLQKIQGRTGTANSVSTIATTQVESEGYFATTATLQLDTERQQAFLNALQRTSDFTAELIVSITPDGEEEVFDVEVDRTENFIANGVVSHNTRWAQRDLTGQVLKSAAQRSGEDWEVIEFPAILPSGNPLWPEFWSVEELEALREELPNSKWQAQYQQNPVGNESAIVKRDWWQWWEQDQPPACEYILQTWDTAFEKSQRADYSAGTTWGIFNLHEDHGTPNIILLNTYKKRVEFPELKRDVVAEYNEFEPDGVLIEKKASGAPLIYELRAMGIPVQEFTPGKGQDKIARLNSVSDIIASGKVWVPRTRWAEELVDEIAAFPSGEHDDLVDATTLALMRFRQGGFLRLPSDEPEEVKWFKSGRRERFYTV